VTAIAGVSDSELSRSTNVLQVVPPPERHFPPGMDPQGYRLRMFGGTLHLQDYSIFHFDIRQNVKDRVEAFFSR
jgi:hypothetical protein